MNPNNPDQASRAKGGETRAGTESSAQTSEAPPEMKRAAARGLIERYFYQLIEGCGNPTCTNENCASSKNLPNPLTRNEAAAKALELVKQKAKLCEPVSTKHVRASPEDQDGGPSHKSDVAAKTMEQKKKDGSDLEEISFLTEEKVYELMNFSKKNKNFSPLVRVIGRVFSNWQALNVSFLKSPSLAAAAGGVKSEEATSSVAEVTLTDKEKSQAVRDEKEEDESEQRKTACRCKSRNRLLLQVDIESVQRTYKALYSLDEERIENALHNAILSLSQMAEIDIRWHQEFQHNPNYLNFFVIIMENPMLHSPENIQQAFPSICKAMSLLPLKAQASLVQFWSTFSEENLRKKLEGLQQLITFKVLTLQIHSFSNRMHLDNDNAITSATKCMKLIYFASILGGELEFETKLDTKSEHLTLQQLLEAPSPRAEAPETTKEDALARELGIHVLDCRRPVIPFAEFYNEPLNDHLEVDHDFTKYKKESENNFSFLNYPFVLTPSTKSTGLFYDNRIRMFEEQRLTVLNSLIQGEQYSPYLKLKVHRDHVVDDALVRLEMVALDNPSDLKKQLYVEFEGEQGVDEGGVSKEFFQLVVEEIFNPDIGMFILNPETNCYWFNPTCFESDRQFTLIGIVLGLAIYNNIILDANFPILLYRKLMGRRGTFTDLASTHPTLYSSLKSILDFSGDVEETFMLNFLISYTDVFGTTVTHKLKDDGENISVTNKNRQEYVDLYADYILNKLVERQFGEFKRGFEMVTSESPLKYWFSPTELELLVCGSRNFDFEALEETTEYDGGYTRDTPVIKYFWEVMHSLEHDQKKQLLMFTTGSDRVPVGGLAKLRLIIAKNGPDSERLPSSHTCFNVLLLPDYSSKEKLREKLLKAITHAKGFGML